MTNELSGAETIGDDASAAMTELGFGDLFADRYRIDRCVGRGSMGTVYAVYDRVVDETVALKLLALREGHSTQSFSREVRLARRVTHRNTARTFDLGQHAGMHFITMELVDGESLRVLLARRGRLMPGEVMDLGLQLGLGLQAAHDVGVIHRDLKPANILLDGGGRAVITDFGVALTMAEDGNGRPLRPLRPRPAGTPMYMAPEQVAGQPIGPAVDVYALGLVLYEALTGRAPFPGHNGVEIAMARLSQPPPDPRRAACVPDALAELVVRCLDRRPRARPPSPGAVAHELTVQIASGRESTDGSDPSRSTGSGLELPGVADRGALAVMPFRYRGIPEESYLAEVLTDELVDLLAMTKGLKVSSSGAASKFRDERDARTVGRALGVDAIIDGTVTRTADRVRIVVRLIDVDTGFQRGTERFEGRLEDVFDLQDRMAKRVAEALRVELTVLDQGRRVSPEAVELYLRGRKHAREPDLSGRSLEDALDQFGQALEGDPRFPLALAARADVAVRRWFLPTLPPAASGTEDWRFIAHEAVEAALAGAGFLAETRLAAARLDVSAGEFVSAARHLTTALDIAPTCAAAHEYLGLLQCEAGRSREGVKHIELAHELDPSLHLAAFSVLRWWALRGKRSAWRKRLAHMRSSPRFFPFAIDLFEYRLSLWDEDVGRARAVRWRAGDPLGAPARFAALLHDALDRTRDDAELAERFEQIVGLLSSPRHRAVWGQIATEVLCWRGALDAGMAALVRADASGVLLDSDWFESCPLLEPLRTDPRFEEIHETIRERAEAIWRLVE